MNDRSDDPQDVEITINALNPNAVVEGKDVIVLGSHEGPRPPSSWPASERLNVADSSASLLAMIAGHLRRITGR